MKLSNPTAIKCISLAASGLIRAWFSTLDVRNYCHGLYSDPATNPRRSIYLFWHEIMLYPAYSYSRFRVAILVSRHRDGELIAQVVRMFRGVSIRGSTDRGGKRGGMAAIRGMMRHGRAHHLAITPDGPRGPRRKVQDGPIYLASRSSMPLIPTGFAFANPWRLGSWDRMALPRPFTRARAVIGPPIDVPKDLNRQRLAEYRIRVQSVLDRVQAHAQHLADTGRTPELPIALERPELSGRQSSLDRP